MDKLIDMHVHTYYSDGEYKPNELVKIAKANNIVTMALTEDIKSLLPHREPFLFVDAIISADEKGCVCEETSAVRQVDGAAPHARR